MSDAAARGRPDAARMPLKIARPAGYPGRRSDFVFDALERLLQVDRAAGERVQRRTQVAMECYFATRDVADTLLFPVGHALEGRSRYNWVEQPDGTVLGWLTDEAKAEEKSDA